MGVQGLNNALNPPGAPHVRTQPLNQVTQPHPHPPPQDQDPDLVQSQDLEPDLQVNPDDQVQGVPTEPQGEEPKAIFLFDIAPRIHNVYEDPLTFHFGKKKLVTRDQVVKALRTAKRNSGESIWSKVKPYVVDMLGDFNLPVGLVLDGVASVDKSEAKSNETKNRSVNLDLTLLFLDLPVLEGPVAERVNHAGVGKVVTWEEFQHLGLEEAQEAIKSNKIVNSKKIVGRVSMDSKGVEQFNGRVERNLKTLLLETRAPDTFRAAQASDVRNIPFDGTRDQGPELRRFFGKLTNEFSISVIQSPHEADNYIPKMVDAAIDSGRYDASNIYVISMDSDLIWVKSNLESNVVRLKPSSPSSRRVDLAAQEVDLIDRQGMLRNNNLTPESLAVFALLKGKDLDPGAPRFGIVRSGAESKIASAALSAHHAWNEFDNVSSDDGSSVDGSSNDEVMNEVEALAQEQEANLILHQASDEMVLETDSEDSEDLEEGDPRRDVIDRSQKGRKLVPTDEANFEDLRRLGKFVDPPEDLEPGSFLSMPIPAGADFLSEIPDDRDSDKQDYHESTGMPSKEAISRVLRSKSWIGYPHLVFTEPTSILIVVLARSEDSGGLNWKKETLEAHIEKHHQTSGQAKADLFDDLLRRLLRSIKVWETNETVDAPDENTLASLATPGQLGRIKKAQGLPRSSAVTSGDAAKKVLKENAIEFPTPHRIPSSSKNEPRKFYPTVLRFKNPIIVDLPSSNPVRERASQGHGHGKREPSQLLPAAELRKGALAMAREQNLPSQQLQEYQEAAQPDFIEPSSGGLDIKGLTTKKKAKATLAGGAAYAAKASSKGRGGSGQKNQRTNQSGSSTTATGLDVYKPLWGILQPDTIRYNLRETVTERLREHVETMIDSASARRLVATIRFNSLRDLIDQICSFVATEEEEFEDWAKLLFAIFGTQTLDGMKAVSDKLYMTDPIFEVPSAQVEYQDRKTLDSRTSGVGAKLDQIMKLAKVHPPIPIIKTEYDEHLYENNAKQMASHIHSMYANRVFPILLNHLLHLLESSILGDSFISTFTILFPKSHKPTKKNEGESLIISLLLFVQEGGLALQNVDEDDDDDDDGDDGGGSGSQEEDPDSEKSQKEIESEASEKEKAKKKLKKLQQTFSSMIAPILGGRQFDLSNVQEVRSMLEEFRDHHEHPQDATVERSIQFLLESIVHLQRSFDHTDSSLPEAIRFGTLFNLFSSTDSSRIAWFLIAFRLFPIANSELYPEPIPLPKKSIPEFTKPIVRESISEMQMISSFSQSGANFDAAFRASNLFLDSLFTFNLVDDQDGTNLKLGPSSTSTYIQVPLAEITMRRRPTVASSSRPKRKTHTRDENNGFENASKRTKEDLEFDEEERQGAAATDRLNSNLKSLWENKIKGAKESEQILVDTAEDLSRRSFWKEGHSPHQVLVARIAEAEVILDLMRERELETLIDERNRLAQDIQQRLQQINNHKVELHPELERRSTALTVAYRDFLIDFFELDVGANAEKEWPFNRLYKKMMEKELEVGTLRAIFSRGGGLDASTWPRTFFIIDAIMYLGGKRLDTLRGRRPLWTLDEERKPIHPLVSQLYESLDPAHRQKVENYLRNNLGDDIFNSLLQRRLGFGLPPLSAADRDSFISKMRTRKMEDNTTPLSNDREIECVEAFVSALPFPYARKQALENIMGENFEAALEEAKKAASEEAQIRREDCGSTAGTSPLSNVASAADPDDPFLKDSYDRNGIRITIDGASTKDRMVFFQTVDHNETKCQLIQGAEISHRTFNSHVRTASRKVKSARKEKPANLTPASKAYATGFHAFGNRKSRRAHLQSWSWRTRILHQLAHEIWVRLGRPTGETSPRPVFIIGDANFRSNLRKAGMPSSSFYQVMEFVIRRLQHCIHFVRVNEYLSSQSIPFEISTIEERTRQRSHAPFINIAQIVNDPADLIGRRRPRGEWPKNGAGKKNTKMILFTQMVWIETVDGESGQWQEEQVLMQRDHASCLMFDLTIRHLLKYKITPNAGAYAPKETMLSKVQRRKKSQVQASEN